MASEDENLVKSLKSRLQSPFAVFAYKKLAFFLGALILAMSLLFVISQAMPQSPAEIMVSKLMRGASGNPFAGGAGGGGGTGGSRYQVLASIYMEKFGVNEPYYQKFLTFWRRFFTMDFGKSVWRYPTTVGELISNRLPWTIALVLPALPVGFVVGNWIGSRAAYYGGKIDNALYYIGNYLQRAPLFWIALVFVMIFASWLDILPAGGAFSHNKFINPELSWEFFTDAVHHWILPFMTLALLPIGGWAVGMRAMTLYEMESDYMQYAKQLGFSEDKLRSIAEKNAILPNFTGLPQIFVALIGQTFIIEIVLGYPGLGSLGYVAAQNADWPLLEATFIITMLIVLTGNLVADILYGVLDPRIGSGYVGGE